MTPTTGKLKGFDTVAVFLLSASLCLASVAYSAPLSQQQLKNAQALADAVDWAQQNYQRTSHPLHVQTLSIEVQEQKEAQPARLARVYQYHYDLQLARVLVVDPDSKDVVSEQTIASIHLPLNRSEIDLAAKLLASHQAITETLQKEQLQRGDVAFETLQELEMKASIYEPTDSEHPCSRQRCALLSLFDSTRTVFAAEPVVFLQSLHVELLRSPR
ncbi:MAG: hypothetical protein AB8B63_02335 [Granulosicoccus sp.]